MTTFDKILNKVLVKKLIKPYYFTDRVLQTGFMFDLDNQHINLANLN